MDNRQLLDEAQKYNNNNKDIIRMDNKERYYQLLHKHKLPDIFYIIPELSYTQKLKIIQNLLQKYSSLIVEHALCEYDLHYIQNDRVNLEIIFSVLKGICEKIKNLKL